MNDPIVCRTLGRITWQGPLSQAPDWPRPAPPPPPPLEREAGLFREIATGRIYGTPDATRFLENRCPAAWERVYRPEPVIICEHGA